MLPAATGHLNCLLHLLRRLPPPQDAEESRETLGRLKRMAGFEAQDFDPMVRLELARG